MIHCFIHIDDLFLEITALEKRSHSGRLSTVLCLLLWWYRTSKSCAFKLN